MKNSDNQDFKNEALQEIKEKVAKHHLSPFKLASLSGLSDVGITKVLDGRTKRPSENTLKKILEGISKFENEKNNPVTLEIINEKLDRVLELIRAQGLDIDILYELMNLSPNTTEELKKLQEKVKKKLS